MAVREHLKYRRDYPLMPEEKLIQGACGDIIYVSHFNLPYELDEDYLFVDIENKEGSIYIARMFYKGDTIFEAPFFDVADARTALAHYFDNHYNVKYSTMMHIYRQYLREQEEKEETK